jgi:hypothetical protein
MLWRASAADWFWATCYCVDWSSAWRLTNAFILSSTAYLLVRFSIFWSSISYFVRRRLLPTFISILPVPLDSKFKKLVDQNQIRQKMDALSNLRDTAVEFMKAWAIRGSSLMLSCFSVARFAFLSKIRWRTQVLKSSPTRVKIVLITN